MKENVMNPNQKYSTALITGAGRGLGRALAIELAKKGVRLALVARSREGLDAVATEIRRDFGQNYPVVTLAADVGDKGAIHSIAGRAAQSIGQIDLLINNASQLGPVPLELLMDTACEDLEAVLQTNLVGPFRLIKAIAGLMLLKERGVIVNISSDAAVTAYPRWGAYSVSKAALDHLTRIFAAELENTGVHFLSVDPGEMNTRMHADAVPDADPRSLRDPKNVAERLVALLYRNEIFKSGAKIVSGAREVL